MNNIIAKAMRQELQICDPFAKCDDDGDAPDWVDRKQGGELAQDQCLKTGKKEHEN